MTSPPDTIVPPTPHTVSGVRRGEFVRPTWRIGDWTGNTVTADGAVWFVHTDDGWFGTGAPPRLAHITRVAADGVHRFHAYRDPRVITLSGNCRAPSGPVIDAACDQLAGLCGDGRLHTLAVTEPDGVTRYASVELAERVKMRRVNRCEFDFEIMLVAADPHRYGAAATATTGMSRLGEGGIDASPPGISADPPGISAGEGDITGAATVTNRGNAASAPLLEIVGPVTQPRVQVAETGWQCWYNGTLAATQSLFINTSPYPVDNIPGHGVMLNGVSSRRHLLTVERGWPTIPPGQTYTFYFSSLVDSNRDARLHIHSRSAWW